MATNRTPAGSKGNLWPDSDTYQRLVGLVVGLKAIADGIVSRFRWSRGAGTTILVTFGEWVGIGLNVPRSRLEVAGPIATAHRRKVATNPINTANEFIGNGDSWLEIQLTSKRTRVYAPDAVTCPGRVLTLSLTSTGGGDTGWWPIGLDTFDGGALGPLLTLPGDFMQIQSDGGTNWKILASKVAGVPA